MGTTYEQICNMALLNVGSKEILANVRTDRTPAATACNTVIDRTIEAVLEEFPWPEATAYVSPGLIEEDPSLDWAFAYRYPSDCVMVRRIVTALGRNDPNPPPFKVGVDASGKLIYTNEAEPTIEYTFRMVDPALFSATLEDAISWRVAERIAPSTSRIKDIVKMCQENYRAAIARARVKAANEQQQEPDMEADHIQARA